MCFILFFNDTATAEIYTYWHTLSLHDARPICHGGVLVIGRKEGGDEALPEGGHDGHHVEPAAEGLRQLDGGADRPFLARGVAEVQRQQDILEHLDFPYRRALRPLPPQGAGRVAASAPRRPGRAEAGPESTCAPSAAGPAAPPTPEPFGETP